MPPRPTSPRSRYRVAITPSTGDSVPSAEGMQKENGGGGPKSSRLPSSARRLRLNRSAHPPRSLSTRRFMRTSLLLVGLLGFGCSQPERYDLVIKGGRVIDPETKLDAVRNLGIRGQRIARI